MKVENAKTKRSKGFNCMLENEIKVLIELKFDYYFVFVFNRNKTGFPFIKFYG